MIQITIPDFVSLPKNDLSQVKGKAGIYVLLDKDDVILYVGKSADLFQRLNMHINSRDISYAKPFIEKIKYFEVFNDLDLEIYETYVINQLRPLFNISKVYNYNPSKAKREYYRNMRKEKGWDLTSATKEELYKFCMETAQIHQMYGGTLAALKKYDKRIRNYTDEELGNEVNYLEMQWGNV